MADAPGSVPLSLWSWAPVRLRSEVRIPHSPTLSQLSLCYQPQKSFYCAVSLHMGAFCAHTKLKHLPQTCLTQKVIVLCGVRRVQYVHDFI